MNTAKLANNNYKKTIDFFYNRSMFKKKTPAKTLNTNLSCKMPRATL